MARLTLFSSKVGFYDHTTSSSTDFRAFNLAITLGNDVLGRHFTILEPLKRAMVSFRQHLNKCKNQETLNCCRLTNAGENSTSSGLNGK